ncbi:uncharacterized protein LOC144876149 isoform X2 [Branchiostoma floridae x Branchiostoma japonicum]
MTSVVHVFKDCTFEGNDIKVLVNSNNNNYTTNNYNYGQQQSGEGSSQEGGRQEHDGATPPPQGNQAPNAASSSQQHPQEVVAGQRQPHTSGGTGPSLRPFPAPQDEADPAQFQFPSLVGNAPTDSLPSLVTASSSCMSSNHSSDAETDLDLSSSNGEVTSEAFTSPKEGRAQHADSAEPGDEDEEEVEDAAATEDEKWEVESKEKEGDDNPTELDDVQISIDQSDGSSTASMPTAGLLLDTGSGLTSVQQTGDQPMSLHSTPSAQLPPETEMNILPTLTDARLSPANAVPSTRQEQNGDMQAQLTAGLLRDLARSDPPDTAAQDETDPEMMARLVRLRGDNSTDTGGMSGESGEGTAVEPTEQAAEPSNGHAQPPHPHIMLHVSPEEPIEGDRVDFELLNVPLHGIGDVEWKHCGILVPQAFGLHYTINSVGQKDAGVYQCVIYKDKEKINIVAVVEVTLHVKKSTDVTGQPCLEEEGGSGGSTRKEQQHPVVIPTTGDRNEDTSMQTGAPLPGSGRNGPSNQSTQGDGDPAAVTSVLGATAIGPEYESLQQRYLQGQRLLKEHVDLSYYPISAFPAGQRDCIVMNAGETTTPFDPMIHKLTAVVAPDGPVTPKKTSPPNHAAPLALSIERKDSASFMKSAAEGEKGKPAGGRGSSDDSGEGPCGRGSSCPPGQRQKDARCPDRSPVQPKKLAVPAQPDIDPHYYNIPLSELMDDADLLEKVKVKLDPDCCGRKNWRHLGSKLGNIPRDELEYFACHGRRTEAVLERVTSERPDTSVGDFMNILYQLKRGDVVETIKLKM